MKKLFILPSLLLIAGLASAQTVSDIVRYSTTTSTGSARSAAMGGAFGALGGDLSSIGVNPAGIGVFRKSEISITPYLNIAKTKSSNRATNDASFQLATFGGVVAIRNKNFDWRGFNFGINYTNLNNFNRITNQHVYNSPTSFNQIWALNANNAIYGAMHSQNPPSENDLPDLLAPREQMANAVGLITYNNQTKEYEPTLLPGEEINQRKYIKEDGYQGEYDFSFGTNYKDKLYLGMTVGVQTIRYKFKSVFTGKGDETNYFGLDQYTFGQYLKTEGVGTNFKFGLIYRPIPELRIGAAIHTPTFYSMTDDYTEDMHSEFYEPDQDNNRSYDSYIIPYTYKYDMQTPWKAVFSAATVLFQKAIFSLDYEYTDYTSAKFSNGENGEDFYDPDGLGANDQIKSGLKKTHNFKAGAEYRFNSTFSVRGGYSYWASPYKTANVPSYLKSDPKIQSVSAGFGLNFGVFFCDVAYIYKFSKDITNFYYYQDALDSAYDIIANPVHNKYIDHSARVTFGVRF